ncbi:hypothetical protein Q3G72_004921 [Acer saccharum]|nr:hypothetical protein Q3G72_032360 [Acer saccharum]KAK1566855.1 hypothetical protein Q3G72_004921 [Acer saccharum]
MNGRCLLRVWSLLPHIERLHGVKQLRSTFLMQLNAPSDQSMTSFVGSYSTRRFTSPFGLELESLICLASLPIDVYNKRPASSESSDFVFLTYLSISLGGKTPISEEERPILANSEFLLTQEGFAGTSNKVHVRLPARSAFAAAADAVATTEPVRLEVLILCLFEETMRMNPKGCFLTHMYPRAGPNEKRIFQEKVVQEKKRRRFRIDVLEKCGRSSALVESTAQFQCQPSWLSWVTGLMLRVEAIQRQERFGSRGHALSLPS